jgi:alpha-mannosidase
MTSYVRNIFSNRYIDNHIYIAGSSIKMVYEDSDSILSNVLLKGQKLIESLLRIIYVRLDIGKMSSKTSFYLNSLSFDRQEYSLKDRLKFKIPQFGFTVIRSKSNEVKASIVSKSNEKNVIFQSVDCVEVLSTEKGGFILQNKYLRVLLSNRGAVLSLLDKRLNPPREVVQNDDSETQSIFGNKLVVYEDIPFYWDAWDVFPYHLEKGLCINGTNPSNIDHDNNNCINYVVSSHPNCVVVAFEHILWGNDNRTKFKQFISLHFDSCLLEFQCSVGKIL